MDALAFNERADARGREDHSRSALEFIHQLLYPADDDKRTLSALLSELARAFGGAGAGLAAPLTTPILQRQEWVRTNDFEPIKYPWETRPDIVEQAKSHTAALALPEARLSWLLTSVWPTDTGGWLLWLQDEPLRRWTPAEQAALPLAGQVLARLAAAHRGTWARSLQRIQRQRHVENAAAVTGRLAHDFGNVLTGILGFAELSLTQLPTDSVPHRYVQEVWQSAQQGANWVRKLQLFSRRSAPQAWPTPLAPILQEEAARLRKAWGSEVALLVAFADDLPPVAIDAESFRQLVVPLLDNAREAIDGPGVVTVSARVSEVCAADCLDTFGNISPGSHVAITITDTGRGMGPEIRGRLFNEMFFSTKPRHRGLGLAVVYGLAQAFHGGLRFGPDPKQGAAVQLLLPCPAPEAGAPAKDTSAARILLVDDDPMILDVINRILDSAGYRVHAAPTGHEAAAAYAAAREPFDLVLSDVNMPGLTGLDLVGRLQQLDPSVNVLFISSLDSAYGLSGSSALLQQFGILPKPFEPEMLLGAVKAALARGGRSSLRRIPAVTEEAWQSNH